MAIMEFNPDELELLAAGYVLDDLDEEEMALVEELLRSSSAMGEQIRQSLAVMGMLTNSFEQVSPPASLKNKIGQAFDEDKEKETIISESENASINSQQKTIINLENWFQQIFEAGWQKATDLLGTPTLTPAFRNSGVEGGRVISIGSENISIILVVKVTEISPSKRDVVVEILPEVEQEYLPSELQLMLLESDGDTVMEATTRQDNKNLKFEFTGTTGESFSVRLQLSNNFCQENFIL